MNTISAFIAMAAIVSLPLAPATFAEQARDAQKETGAPGADQESSAAPAHGDQETLKPSAPTELTGWAMPGRKVSLVKASELIGYSVKNRHGEELGVIEELVINPQDGRITYAALSVGGFLGMGDKLFAIPWEALTPMPKERTFTLDVNKEKLAETPGFDENNWPDMASHEWGTSVDNFHDQKPSGE